MQIRHFVRSVLLLTPLLAACGSDASSAALPTAPTISAAAEPALSLQAITSVPSGAGVQYNTDFQFTAAGTFPSGTQFTWRFGDGSSTTTNTPTVGRIYGETGTFDVAVEARAGGASAAASRSVTVRSLIGRWVGSVTGFSSFPLQRPVAMTGFELLVTGMTRQGSGLLLEGRWADSSGCRETRRDYLRQPLQPEPAARVTFGVDALPCAAGDFYLTGLADANFNTVQGTCDVAGGNPGCRFTMDRQ